MNITAIYVLCSLLKNALFPAGVLFTNLMQWTLSIFTQHSEKEMETNFVFFACTMLTPMLLLLSLEVSVESPISFSKSLPNSDGAYLHNMQRYLGFGRRNSNVSHSPIRLRRMSLQIL